MAAIASRLHTFMSTSYEIEVSVERNRTWVQADIARAVRATLQREGCERAALSVAVVDDIAIAELHKRYLGIDEPTDVLSFDLADAPGDGSVDGQIVVSSTTATREAKERGIPVRHELLRYVIHGTLHLLGYSDATPAEAEIMHGLEDELIAVTTNGGPKMEKG